MFNIHHYCHENSDIPTYMTSFFLLHVSHLFPSLQGSMLLLFFSLYSSQTMMLYGAGKGLMFYGHVKIHINGYGYSMYSEPPRLNYYCQIQQKWSSSTSRGTKQKKQTSHHFNESTPWTATMLAKSTIVSREACIENSKKQQHNVRGGKIKLYLH